MPEVRVELAVVVPMMVVMTMIIMVVVITYYFKGDMINLFYRHHSVELAGFRLLENLMYLVLPVSLVSVPFLFFRCLHEMLNLMDAFLRAYVAVLNFVNDIENIHGKGLAVVIMIVMIIVFVVVTCFFEGDMINLFYCRHSVQLAGYRLIDNLVDFVLPFFLVSVIMLCLFFCRLHEFCNLKDTFLGGYVAVLNFVNDMENFVNKRLAVVIVFVFMAVIIVIHRHRLSAFMDDVINLFYCHHNVVLAGFRQLDQLKDMVFPMLLFPMTVAVVVCFFLFHRMFD